MVAKVLANPCESCKTLDCNSCRNHLISTNDDAVEITLSADPLVGVRHMFTGCKKIKTTNTLHQIRLGDVITRLGGFIQAVGEDRKFNQITLVYRGDNLWMATELVGTWEVETE